MNISLLGIVYLEAHHAGEIAGIPGKNRVSRVNESSRENVFEEPRSRSHNTDTSHFRMGVGSSLAGFFQPDDIVIKASRTPDFSELPEGEKNKFQ